MAAHLRRKAKLPIDRELFLSAFSGLETGVATTTAIILGLLVSGSSISVVMTAALVTLSVQAFNASVARYLSLRTTKEIDDQTYTERKGPLVNAVIQFIAHITASSMPILPLIFFYDPAVIALASVGASVLTLAIAGLVQGLFIKIQAKQNLQEIILSGMMVVLVGSIAGFLLR